MPSKLLDMPSAKLVANWYRQSFEDLLLFEHADPTIDKVNLFNDQLQTILKRHGHVVSKKSVHHSFAIYSFIFVYEFRWKQWHLL